MIGRICEEFSCLPSEAEAELRRQPAGWLEEVIEARAYARAKWQLDAADSSEARKALPDTTLMNLAKRIELDITQEMFAEQTDGPDADD